MKIYIAVLVIGLTTYATKATVTLTCPECTEYLCGPICVDKMCAMEVSINDTDVLGCLNDLNTTIDNTQSTIETLNTTIIQLGNEITSINNSIVNASACCIAINTTITNIEGNIVIIEGSINNIEGDITNIEGDVTNIELDIPLLNTSVQENTQCCQEVNATINNNITITDSPSGETLINDGTGPEFIIKRILAGNGITITSNPTNLELSLSGPILIYAKYAFNSVSNYVPNYFLQPQGNTALEAEAQYIIPVDGVLQDLYMETSAVVPGGQFISCFLNVNSGATAVAADVSGGTTGNSGVTTTNVSAGDLLSIFCSGTGGSPSSSIIASIGLAGS